MLVDSLSKRLVTKLGKGVVRGPRDSRTCLGVKAYKKGTRVRRHKSTGAHNFSEEGESDRFVLHTTYR